MNRHNFRKKGKQTFVATLFEANCEHVLWHDAPFYAPELRVWRALSARFFNNHLSIFGTGTPWQNLLTLFWNRCLKYVYICFCAHDLMNKIIFDWHVYYINLLWNFTSLLCMCFYILNEHNHVFHINGYINNCVHRMYSIYYV